MPLSQTQIWRFWRPSKRSCHYPTHAGAPKLLKGKDVTTLQISRCGKTVWRIFYMLEHVSHIILISCFLIKGLNTGGGGLSSMLKDCLFTERGGGGLETKGIIPGKGEHPSLASLATSLNDCINCYPQSFLQRFAVAVEKVTKKCG